MECENWEYSLPWLPEYRTWTEEVWGGGFKSTTMMLVNSFNRVVDDEEKNTKGS